MAEKVELDIDLAAVKQELKQLQAELQKLGAEGESTFQGVVKEAQELAKAQREVSAEVKGASTALNQAGNSAGSFGGRVKNAILNANVFGKSISEWGGQLKGLSGFLGAGEGAVGKFGGAFKVLGNIIKLSPIGLLIGVVAALIGYFTRFQSGIDKVSQITAGLSATVNVLIERFLKLGSALVKVFSGDFAGAAKDIQGAVSGIGDELYNAATAAANLEKRFQDLRDASRTAGVEAARINVALQQAKQIADDTNQSFARRTAAAQKAAELERKLADQAVDLALERNLATQEEFRLNKDNLEVRDRAAQAEIDFQNAVADRNSAIYEGESKIKDIRKEAGEQAKKRADDAQKERDKLLKDLQQLRVEIQAPGSDERVIAEVEKKYADLIKKAEDGVAKLNEIEKNQKGGLSAEQIAQRKEFSDIIVKLKKQELEAIVDALTELSDKELQVEEEAQKAKQALQDKDVAAAKKNFENIKAIRDSEIAVTEENFKNFIKVMKSHGASKEDVEKAQLEFDNLTQEQRLKNEIEFQENLLSITAAGDETAITLAKNKIQKLKAELDGLSVPSGDGPKGDRGKPLSLGELLGVSDDDMDAFDSAVSQIKDGLAEIMQARLDAAQAAVDAADQEVEAATNKVDRAAADLDREIALAELGFASDVTESQKKLALAQKEEQAAKAAKERALQDQKKAQRTQLILDTALQASNLITAVTSTFKTFNGPLLPLGIALVALMLGTFIYAKVKAFQAVKGRDGIQGKVGAKGIIVGPSHDNGGVPLEVEGGEFAYQDGKRIAVVNKRATNAHFELLQAINDDDRPSMARYLERLTGGISRNPDVGGAPSGAGSASSVQVSHADSTTHKLLEENNRLQRKIIELEENREQVYDLGDEILVKRKGREERIKKRTR